MRILKLVLILSIAVFSFQCSRKEEAFAVEGWNKLDGVLEKISPPAFADQIFIVTDFGAASNDEIDDRDAINSAIERCNAEDGGIVIIPAGEFISNGPIVLKSNVNLQTEEGTIVKFGTNPDDYLPVVKSRWEGVELYNYSSLFYAYQAENIAITGKGVFDGQAANENWWSWKGKTEYGWEEGMPSQANPDARPLLMQMNLDEVPVKERVFGEGKYLRPNFIQFLECKNILLEEFTLLDSPMWFIHPVLCENITVRKIKVFGKGPNNDGCNPESSKYVLIKDSFFDTGDDCIAIKSGRNNDGRRIGVASEYIVVQNCEMKDGHGGVVMGSEISGSCRYVFVEDCIMDSPNLDRAIRVKTNDLRGGIVENIFVRNVSVGQVHEAILKLNMNYEPNAPGERIHKPVIRNIILENVTSSKSKYALYLDGLEESSIKNIILKNCEFDGVEEGSIIRNVENLEFVDFYINDEKQ